MQYFNRGIYGQPVDPAPPREEPASALTNPDLILGIIRRQAMLVTVFVVMGGLIGVAAIMSAVPQYTAQASVLIDPANSQVVNQLSTLGGTAEGETAVMSQLELLKSDAIATAVIKKLDLVNDQVFNSRQQSIFTLAKKGLRALTNLDATVSGTPSPVDEEQQIRAAISKLLDGMTIERVARTYVIEIGYTSPSPQLSAKIANGIAEAYLVDKLDSKYEATRRASSWLQERISQLRQQALASDLAVQRFRADHGLLQTGARLVSDQQLSELNSALIVARADTSRVRAKLEQISSIIAGGQSDAIVSDVLDSPIANELHRKYLDAAKLERQISTSVGSNHIQAVRLRNEMEEYKRLMFGELGRIAESYKSELDVAVAREKNLSESVAEASGVSATANETQVQLREMEREAESYRTLHQTFLQRYQEAVQQQSFPVTEARVITRAQQSGSPSSPKKAPIFVLFCMLGGMAGLGLAGYREFRDRYFRNGEQIREVLNLEHLGNVPLIENAAAANSPNGLHAGDILPPVGYAASHPWSSFAETLRAARIAIDFTAGSEKCKVIGVTSTLPGEGKSTISINLAELLASQGARVILIDGDLRNPGTTTIVAPHANEGLIEALTESRDPRRLLLKNTANTLSFLPAVPTRRVSHSAELLSSQQMHRVLTSFTSEADYVIIDLPPLGPVVDARAISSRLDGFLYVVEWGKTARRVVRETLSTEIAVGEKCIGVILNKVDTNKMKLYQSFGSSDYYRSSYLKYYQAD